MLVARDYGARLIIFNALEPPFTHGRWTVELPDDHARLMMERLRQFRPCTPDLAVEYRQEEGEPAELILRMAEEQQCDLIVMGTHGRHGIGRVLLGGFAERVLRRAGCPVLIVRSPLPHSSTAPASTESNSPVESLERDDPKSQVHPSNS